MFRYAVPVMRVGSSAAAVEYYCNQLGFHQEFSHRMEESESDPSYMGLIRDGVRLHVSSFPGDGVSGSVVYIAVDDVDALHAELVAKNVSIDSGPMDQTWGTREMYVKDADRNCIRFVQQGRS